MVCRLVSEGLLCRVTRKKSPRACDRREAGLAGRVMAASHQGEPLCGALQHSAALSIRGLWIPRGVRRVIEDCAGQAKALRFTEDTAAFQVRDLRLAGQQRLGGIVLPPGPRP